MSFLHIIISSLSFIIIFLYIYKSISLISTIYDKAFETLKNDITALLIPYLIFAAPFWISIFYFFANISRTTGSIHDKLSSISNCLTISILVFQLVFLEWGLNWFCQGQLFWLFSNNMIYLLSEGIAWIVWVHICASLGVHVFISWKC